MKKEEYRTPTKEEIVEGLYFEILINNKWIPCFRKGYNPPTELDGLVLPDEEHGEAFWFWDDLIVRNRIRTKI